MKTAECNFLLTRIPDHHPLRCARMMIFSYLHRPLSMRQSVSDIIRDHLKKSYCDKCGEYIYQYKNRRIRHIHSKLRKYRMDSLMQRHLLIHSSFRFIEWQRRFPRVSRFTIVKNTVIIRTSPRILARHLWTFDEWHYQYPQFVVDEFKQRVDSSEHPLFIPDLRV